MSTRRIHPRVSKILIKGDNYSIRILSSAKDSRVITPFQTNPIHTPDLPFWAYRFQPPCDFHRHILVEQQSETTTHG